MKKRSKVRSSALDAIMAVVEATEPDPMGLIERVNAYVDAKAQASAENFQPAGTSGSAPGARARAKSCPAMKTSRRQHLGVGYTFERDGSLWLRLRPIAVQMFGLRPGDVVRWRKRRLQTSYTLTFWRNGKAGRLHLRFDRKSTAGSGCCQAEKPLRCAIPNETRLQ
jgi:hypothetical protein